MVKGVGMKKPCPSTIPQRNKLQQFRQAIYAQVFTQARDALFELLEALLVHSRVASFVELCLAAVFRRQWASGYAALRDGRIDPDALERLLVAQVPATGTAVFPLAPSPSENSGGAPVVSRPRLGPGDRLRARLLAPGVGGRAGHQLGAAALGPPAPAGADGGRDGRGASAAPLSGATSASARESDGRDRRRRLWEPSLFRAAERATVPRRRPPAAGSGVVSG